MKSSPMPRRAALQNLSWAALASAGLPGFVETISTEARSIPFLTGEFMAGFPGPKVTDITPFLKLCRRGTPPLILTAPEGADPRAFDQQLQKAEFEKSIATLRALT